jgi:hypothetical protein
MILTEGEIDMIRSIIRFYLNNQSFQDETFYNQIQDLYDKVSFLIPNASLGSI